MLTFWQDTVHPRGDIGLFICLFVTLFHKSVCRRLFFAFKSLCRAQFSLKSLVVTHIIVLLEYPSAHIMVKVKGLDKIFRSMNDFFSCLYVCVFVHTVFSLCRHQF